MTNILAEFNPITITVAPGANPGETEAKIEATRTRILEAILVDPYTPDQSGWGSERQYWTEREEKEHSNRLNDILVVTAGTEKPKGKQNPGSDIQSMTVKSNSVTTSRATLIECVLQLSSLCGNVPVGFEFNKIALTATAPESVQDVERRLVELEKKHKAQADRILKEREASQPQPVKLKEGMVVKISPTWYLVKSPKNSEPDPDAITIPMRGTVYNLKDAWYEVLWRVPDILSKPLKGEYSFSEASLQAAKAYSDYVRKHGMSSTLAPKLVDDLMKSDPEVNKLVWDIVRAKTESVSTPKIAGEECLIVKMATHTVVETGMFSSGHRDRVSTYVFARKPKGNKAWKTGGPVFVAVEGEWNKPPEPVRKDDGTVVTWNKKGEQYVPA